MNSPAEIIAQLLIDLEQGTADGEWPIYISFFPDTPDEGICVYDTAGIFDGRLMGTGEKIEHQGIQVQVRGKTYSDAWVKANAIALAFDSQFGIEMADDSSRIFTIQNISRTGAILPLGIEAIGDRRRHGFSINAILTMNEEDGYTPLIDFEYHPFYTLDSEPLYVLDSE